jgi:hypothetical protein
MCLYVCYSLSVHESVITRSLTEDFALLEVHTGRLDFPREENPCEYTARRETRERERVRAFHDFPVSRQEKERLYLCEYKEHDWHLSRMFSRIGVVRQRV